MPPPVIVLLLVLAPDSVPVRAKFLTTENTGDTGKEHRGRCMAPKVMFRWVAGKVTFSGAEFP